ncbi:Uncharacterised protein [Mycolicibacterium phlei]|uniref:hypothetical protein n=1 Tax=Mycobacteroides chelonae TaxID=1774 RepID=UPI000AC49714|nr:hypothetical protein [Mycobacteroides chelonae]VEG16004.1 Uncharacterised protein [Mycolicibacterium phlei]
MCGCSDVIECTGLIDGVGQIKPQPDGTVITEYDVRVTDLAQRFAAHYLAKH